jgi:hypothetical protein
MHIAFTFTTFEQTPDIVLNCKAQIGCNLALPIASAVVHRHKQSALGDPRRSPWTLHTEHRLINLVED